MILKFRLAENIRVYECISSLWVINPLTQGNPKNPINFECCALNNLFLHKLYCDVLVHVYSIVLAIIGKQFIHICVCNKYLPKKIFELRGPARSCDRANWFQSKYQTNQEVREDVVLILPRGVDLNCLQSQSSILLCWTASTSDCVRASHFGVIRRRRSPPPLSLQYHDAW